MNLFCTVKQSGTVAIPVGYQDKWRCYLYREHKNAKVTSMLTWKRVKWEHQRARKVPAYWEGNWKPQGTNKGSISCQGRILLVLRHHFYLSMKESHESAPAFPSILSVLLLTIGPGQWLYGKSFSFSSFLSIFPTATPPPQGPPPLTPQCLNFKN